MKLILIFLFITGCASHPKCLWVCRPDMSGKCEKVCKDNWDE